MHRLLIVRTSPDSEDRFRVVADSADPSVSESNTVTIQQAGGSDWAEFDDSTGYSSPYASLPCQGTVSGLGYWYVNKTGNVLDFDFVQAGLSEQKVIMSGELHAVFADREYVARAGDSMIFLVDLNDRQDDRIRSFPVRFLGNHEAIVMYTEYALS